MPYKAHEPRRHKIPRARYTVANRPEGTVNLAASRLAGLG
jgi:hypothetical protein